jgi:DNA-binding NarL/FixJ family response regulator
MVLPEDGASPATNENETALFAFSHRPATCQFPLLQWEQGMTRVLLAEDHFLVRAGLRALLEQARGIDIVAEASNGVEAVALVERHLPDVVLMDISMPLMDGLQATREIKQKFPFVNILILSMHVNEAYVKQALRAGASGYLLKDAETEDLAHALKVVSRGSIHLGPRVSRQLVESYLSRIPAVDEKPGVPELVEEISITTRQREILQCIAEGLTGKETGRRLGISPKTVEGHRAQLMQRLHIYDVPGLVRYAIRIGLIEMNGAHGDRS